jgi:DNA-binding NarL/FixJ family response regulator
VLRRTRILIAGMPPIASRILRDLVAADPQLEVVDCIDEGVGLSEEIARGHADAIITRASDAREAERWAMLLHAHPGLRMIVLSADGRSAFVYRVVSQRTVLHDVSAQALLTALHPGDVLLH